MQTTTAPRTFGIKEFDQVTTDAERHVEEIKILGYTVVPNVLDDAKLQLVRERLDHLYQVQIDEINGEEKLRMMGDAYTVRCPLAYDPLFLEVATQPKVLAVVEKLLGEYFTLLSQNGLLNVPIKGTDHNAGSWHRDLNYQHYVSSRPLSISGLMCIDPFNDETGGTIMLPASHKTEKFPSMEFAEGRGIGLTAPAGSCVVFDSMLFHRAGSNRSKNTRRAINHMYTVPFIKQQISLPRLLEGKYKDDPFLAKFLGYESEPADSVFQFRSVRIARAEKVY